MSNPEAFYQFERSGWEDIPRRYDRAFGHLTRQAIAPLLDAAGIKQGDRVLDLATGPGYVAAAAAERGADVVGVDFSRAMIARARELYPELEFKEANIEELPFPGGMFDAAVMNFGILHLGRPERAMAEAHRVLRAGGRFAFSVWGKPEEAIGFGIVLRAIAAFGESKVALPEGPPFFHYSEPAHCIDSLTAAGFMEPVVTQVSQTWRLPPGDALFEAMLESTVRTAGLLRAQEPVALENIRRAIRNELVPYTHDEMVELPMPALIASATKRG
jgi:ubiquinone/menaquinone biosynthesis C-methylase UbiE